MEVKERRIVVLKTTDGKIPYKKWLKSIADKDARSAIDARVTRARFGNFGDHKFFLGLIEMRIDFGPGYRIYCGIHNDEIIVLVGGGDKKSQQKDIDQAARLWKEYIDG